MMEIDTVLFVLLLMFAFWLGVYSEHLYKRSDQRARDRTNQAAEQLPVVQNTRAEAGARIFPLSEADRLDPPLDFAQLRDEIAEWKDDHGESD